MIGRVVPAVMRQMDTDELLEFVDVNAIAAELDLDALVGRVDVNAIADRLDLDALVRRVDVNAVAGELDLEALVDRLDVDAIAARLDLDVMVDRLDVNAIAGRLDLEALVDRLDVDAIAARLDLDVLVDRLDVNAIAGRVDLKALVDRLDVDVIAGRLDLDALVRRVDVDAMAGQLDLDRLVDRIDLNAVAGRIDVARLTAGATQDVATSGLDLVRRQLVRGDVTVDRVGDRLLRRSPGSRPVAPPELARTEGVVEERSPTAPSGRRTISGHYAGPLTQVAAVTLDVIIALAVAGVLSSTALYIVEVFTPLDVSASWILWVVRAMGLAWFVGWFWVPVALFDRTLAMAVLGIAVVSRQGGRTSSWSALRRALALPVSLLLFGLGFVGLVIGRERRTFHDVVGGTAVVYDWGEREAEQPATISELLTARVNRTRARTGGGVQI